MNDEFALIRVDTGEYLAAFDPEWQPDPLPQGVPSWLCGRADWTRDPAEAMRFESSLVALECWRTQSVTRPVRGDGKPNRPLTKYSISPVLLP